MTYEFVDVNGLAGGLSLGAARSGLKMTARTGYLGLGRKIVKANAGLFDGGAGAWADDIVDTDEADEWPLHYAPVVLAVPPCSGFSSLTGKGAAATTTESAHAGHKMNDCMWHTAKYVARVKPEIYIFESVTGAWNQGRELMQTLRDYVEDRSGESYVLTHVLHDGISLGSPASRKRYLFVLTKGRRGFTPVRHEPLDRATTVAEAIADLPLIERPYPKGDVPYGFGQVPSSWIEKRNVRRADGLVDGMWHKHNGQWSVSIDGILDVMKRRGTPWPQSCSMTRAMQMLHNAGSDDAILEAFHQKPELGERMIGREFNMGPYDPTRWGWDIPGRVITGGGPMYTIHPQQDRHLHYRELARIMGYPDEFKIDTATGEKLDSIFGKNVAVTVGEWIGQSVIATLENDGTTTRAPILIGDREYLIDELDDGRRLVREWKARFTR